MKNATWETRLSLTVTVVFILLLLFQVGYVIPMFRDREQLAAVENQLAIASGIAHQVDSALRGAERSLLSLAAQPEVQQLLIDGQSPLLTELAESSTVLSSLFALDRNGHFVAGSTADITAFQKMTYSDRPFFVRPFLLGESHYSACQFYESPGILATSISVPIHSPSGETLGVLMGGLRIDQQLASIVGYPLPDNTVAYLVDSDGTVVVHSVMGILTPRSPGLQGISSHPLVQAVAARQDSRSAVYEHQGVSYQGVVAMAMNDWGVIVETPLQTISQPSQALSRQLTGSNLVVIGLMLLISLATIWETYRRHTQAVQMVEQERSEMQILNSAISEMNRTPRRATVVDSLQHALSTDASIPAGAIFAYDQAEDILIRDASWGTPDEWGEAVARIDMAVCPRDADLRRGRTVLEACDSGTSANSFLNRKELGGMYRYCLCLPILWQTRLEGVLVLLDNDLDGLDRGRNGLLAAICLAAGPALHNAQLYDQLQQQHQMLRHVSRQVAQARQQERQRLARNLHDQSSQSLTALRVGLRVLGGVRADEQAWSEQISQLDAQIDSLVDEMHRVIEDLRPSSLEHLGLEAALQDYLAGVGRRHHIETRLQVEAIDASSLSPAVEEAIYHGVRELATNAARHSQASRVDVLLMHDSDTIRVVVEDDGQGFDPEDVDGSDHRGLRGLAERATTLGGQVVIESSAEQGTTILMEIPDDHSNPDR